MTNKHAESVRAAALVAQLRHDRASFEALIAAAEAIEQLERDHHAEITSREQVQAELAAVKAERDGLGRMVHDRAVQLQRAERALRDACDYLGSNRLNTIGSGSQLHRQMIEALDDNANNRF